MSDNNRQFLLYVSLALNGILIFSIIAYLTINLTSGWFISQTEPRWKAFYFERLEVTDPQWEQLRPQIIRYKQNWQENCEEIAEYRRKIFSKLENQEDFTEPAERIALAQKEMLELVLTHIDSQRTVLTEEQERLFFERLRQSTNCTH